MTVKKVFDLQKELYHEKGCRVLLILLCQAYEVLEPLWAGQLSLKCIQIFFLSDSTNKNAFPEKVQKPSAILMFFWKWHNKHNHVNNESFTKAISNYRRFPEDTHWERWLLPLSSKKHFLQGGFFFLEAAMKSSCTSSRNFWSHLGHLLRGSGSAGHGIIGSSLNFWVLFGLALSTERIESVWVLVFQISYLILKWKILCFLSWSIV